MTYILITLANKVDKSTKYPVATKILSLIVFDTLFGGVIRTRIYSQKELPEPSLSIIKPSPSLGISSAGISNSVASLT